MTVVLTTTWNPRGELARFERLFPLLADSYDALVIVFPPVADPAQVDTVISADLLDRPEIRVKISPDWSWGRHLALEQALQFPCTHVHYADMDRVLRWVETRPEELLDILRHIMEFDCLIMGRSRHAFGTHPQAMIKTEAISNRVVSYFLGREMDVSAGSKAFSRAAVETILRDCSPGNALGTDAEWPLTLHKAGYVIDYVQVDGLDWESADRYKEQAADQGEQEEAAAAYDADPESWAQRVEVAQEIIEVCLRAIGRW